MDAPSTTGRARLATRMYPHHATSTVTEVVIDKARRAVLANAEGDSHTEMVADARELMAMLGLIEPANLFRPVEVGDTSTMGAEL